MKTDRHHKGEWVKSWIRERILFLALVIFVGGAVAYIGTDKFFPRESLFFHPIKEFSLLIAMIGVVSLGYELFLRELTFNEYKSALEEIVNPDAVRLGITGIYKNRSELGQSMGFEKLFQKVQREIFIGGTSLLSISTNSREIIKAKVLKGIDVRLLLMNPDSPVVDFIAKQGKGKPTFVNEIRTSLLLLQKLQEEILHELDGAKKGRLIIHAYDTIPSHSFISLDEGHPNGLIIADIGPYLGRSVPRPSLVVVNKKDGLYEYWQEMNANMWEQSKALTHDEKSPPSSHSRTLVLVSGKETEYYDTKMDTWRPASICQMDHGWRTIKGSQWVWIREGLALDEARTGSHNKFRLRFNLPPGAEKAIVRSVLYVRSAGACHIAVNDKALPGEYGGANYPDPFVIDIDRYLREGQNAVVFELISFANPAAAALDGNRIGIAYRLDLEYRE